MWVVYFYDCSIFLSVKSSTLPAQRQRIFNLFLSVMTFCFLSLFWFPATQNEKNKKKRVYGINKVTLLRKMRQAPPLLFI